jgi:hypothetical protein
MKVIGAGLPRTGTLSQKVALEMAGFGPCYHMVNVLGDLSEVGQWQRAVEGGVDFDELFAGFGASVDWPGAYFYRELIEAFPEAKVVLSVRDGQAWERSMRETIWGVIFGDGLMTDLSRARMRIDPEWRAYMELMEEMWHRSGLLGSGEAPAPGELAAAMERYNAQVVADVPEDRLLVWSVSEGWDRLCPFLEIDTPSAPFPRLNDSREFEGRIIDGALIALHQWRQTGAATAPAVDLPGVAQRTT